MGPMLANSSPGKKSDSRPGRPDGARQIRRRVMRLRNITGGAALLLLLCVAAAFGQTDPKSRKEIRQPVPPPTEAEPRFRVILTGFTVNRQTSDNILESDGRGDEVYIAAEVAQFD